jgi:hypothetical protein
MVPQVFHDYFVASTGAGVALLGLLFVAVSIAPERTVMSTAPVERQAAATSAYVHLRLFQFAQDRNRERGLCDPGSEAHAICP